MGSAFGTYYEQIPSAKTVDYTVVVADDLVPFTATTSALTATLYTPAGNLAYASAQGGHVRIQNNTTSTNIVNVTSASGSVYGPAILYPGQVMTYLSDGSNWYAGSQLPGFGQLAVSISSANFLALNSTPISLIPTPGTGKVIIVDSVTLKMVTTASGYGAGGALEFRYTNASGAKVSADIASGVVTAGAGTSFTHVRGVTTSLTAVAAAAIILDAASADFTGGTGTATCTLQYRVL